MELTLAIPVHNDTAPLLRLLGRWRELGSPYHVIVVDDGSAPALDAKTLHQAAGLDATRLTLLRNDSPQGPGAARNRALAQTETDLVLFMDADDLPTRELPHLLVDLDGRDFDFCLFQHHDTRAEREWRWGQMPHDQQLWQAADLNMGALRHVSPEVAGILAQTANYPWNKIYRTDFLRAYSIGCSEILVHEDVELHWRSFLNADTILASDRIGVIHFVATDGDRLTNRDGAERLAVFGPLACLAAEIAAKRQDYALSFTRFALGLCLWINGNLHPDHQADFAAALRHFVHDDAPSAALTTLRDNNPDLMAQIEALIASDRA